VEDVVYVLDEKESVNERKGEKWKREKWSKRNWLVYVCEGISISVKGRC